MDTVLQADVTTLQWRDTFFLTVCQCLNTVVSPGGMHTTMHLRKYNWFNILLKTAFKTWKTYKGKEEKKHFLVIECRCNFNGSVPSAVLRVFWLQTGSRRNRAASFSGVVVNWSNMATVPVYCICRLPYDVTRFMIECDACKDWFHGR